MSIIIRPYQEPDLPFVLKLLEQSDSTSRSEATWRGNGMTAVLAFDGENLIGVIPFERRQLVISPQRDIPVLWASGVHVDEKFRGRGIGAAMDAKMEEFFCAQSSPPPHPQAALVFRQDEGTPAYRWYKKIGYSDLIQILAFKKDVRAGVLESTPVAAYIHWQSKEEIFLNETKILDCFERNMKGFCGYSKRHPRFWSGKFEFHYYKAFYRYSVLALPAGDGLIAYALLGRTSMRDGVERFDILEFVSPPEGEVSEKIALGGHLNDFSSSRKLYNFREGNKLYQSVMDCASGLGLKEIRWQVSLQDPNLEWIQSLGFTQRWETKILGKMIRPANSLLRSFPAVDLWRYFQVDYV